MEFETSTILAILNFVDSIIPPGCQEIWLTGSRVRGNAQPDSDWDIIAFHPDAPQEDSRLFESNQIGFVDGVGEIELIIAHPRHWNHPSRYMTECRKTGVRLR